MVELAARQGNGLLPAVSGEVIVDEFATVVAVYFSYGKGQVADETPQHWNDINGGIAEPGWPCHPVGVVSMILRVRMNRSR